MNKYQVNEQGFYGEFGGSFVPEPLQACIAELQENYLPIIQSDSFQKEYHQLLRDYVGRPSPLYLAKRLSARYGCTIYLKREDLNHTGAHKINNTIGQILLAKRMGKKRIVAETGAGQHGVATATVCALMDMECIIYMGKVDMERQHLNVERMRMLGAKVVAATSGGMTLTDAVNEALQYWVSCAEDTFYLLGSAVGPHPYPDMVVRLQSVISSEIKEQIREATGRDYPDYLMACVGGGSNAGGTVYHFLEEERAKIIFAEAAGKGINTPQNAATMSLGKAGYIHGFKTLVMQTADGEVAEPYSISAGLDYPGVGPLHAHLIQTGRAKAVAVTDEEAIKGAYELTRLEGIIPALESAHVLGALSKCAFQSTDVIVLTVSGRGDKDIETYLTHKPTE